jgi:heme/copper-type cytochrome/quinol oxidase subunit 3
MAIVTSEHGDTLDDGDRLHVEGGGREEGHHESPEHRDHRERLGLWIFIAGDAFFLLLELFAWFYLRALNTSGMWRGVACTTASPCTDGLGNPITHEIAKASPGYTIVIVQTVERAAAKGDSRSVMSGLTGVAIVVLLGAVAVGCYQFGKLPFQTIDGSYASAFEFFMGSSLVHIVLLTFIIFGMWNRIRVGRYDDGRWHRVRLIRMFTVWIAISVCVLAVVMSLFA